MPIDGLASNLDTSALLSQLMEVERAPQALLEQRRSGVQADIDAYAGIRSRLVALDTAADALRRPAAWLDRTATSSSDAVVASATAGAGLGSLTFTVDALASRHGLRSGNVITATTDVIASGGSIQITAGSDVHTIDVGGGTLAQVVDAVNRANVGVRAAAVDTGSGFRLQLESRATGAGSAFTVSAGLDAGVGGMVVTSAGADAVLTVGSGPGAYSITSASNTLSGVLGGLTLTLKRVSADPVTVEVAADREGLLAKVQALVAAANAVRAEVTTRTAYDPTARKAAALAGDGTARQVAQDLTRALVDAVGASALGSSGGAGLSVDRNGQFTFDAARFRATYDTDPTAVERLFAHSAETSGSIRFLAAGDRTDPGSYGVVVTASATNATAAGLSGTWPPADPTTVVVRSGGREASYTTLATDTAADAAAGLQAALDAEGLSLTVSVDGGGLRIDHDNPGSAARFEVAWDGTTFTDHAGTDVAGTIGGVTATGSGTTLTVPPATAGLGGLSVGVIGNATGSIGTVAYDRGVAQRVASAIDRALDTVDGYLTTREAGSTRRINDLDASIAAWEQRLSAREKRLRQQYAQLEVALSRLQSQSSWLSGQLAGLSGSGSTP